jgi:hypothetical protein
MLIALLFPAALVAQETVPEPGMVLEEGTWQAPTAATALRALVNREGTHPRAPAVALLRQTFEPRSANELGAFADQLTRIMLEGDEETAREARLTLIVAASNEYPDEEEGIPYTRAVDAFIRVYEAQEDKASDEAWNAMGWISDTYGIEYILETFNTAEIPPRCLQHALPDPESEIPVEDPCRPRSEWCSAGLYLFGTPHAPDDEEYDSRCVRRW